MHVLHVKSHIAVTSIARRLQNGPYLLLSILKPGYLTYILDINCIGLTQSFLWLLHCYPIFYYLQMTPCYLNDWQPLGDRLTTPIAKVLYGIEF